MQLEAKKYLFDIQQAANKVLKFTAGKRFEIYDRDELLSSGVERQFEIMGEALNLLSKLNPELAAKIDGYKKIIAFRNVLIHGYANVDNRLVWNIIESKLPTLLNNVNQLLETRDP